MGFLPLKFFYWNGYLNALYYLNVLGINFKALWFFIRFGCMFQIVFRNGFRNFLNRNLKYRAIINPLYLVNCNYKFCGGTLINSLAIGIIVRQFGSNTCLRILILMKDQLKGQQRITIFPI